MHLDSAQCQPRGEHREKPIGVEQQGGSVGEGDQPQREKVIEANRLPMHAAQIEDQATGRGPQQRADK